MWIISYTLRRFSETDDIVAHMKKYFIIFAAIAILGMLAIYFVPNKKTSSTTSSVTAAANSSTSTSTTPSTASATDTTSTATTSTSSTYKDGTYTGANVTTHYGNIKVAITVKSGKITDVSFLAVPNDEERSLAISNEATPILESQTISAQGANIDGVSGAATTTMGYIKSLQAAIDAAKAS